MVSYHTWRLVTSPPFENFVLLLIILNTFSLMLKYHDAPLFYVDILSYLNLLFTTLFTIEAIMKVFGYGPKVCGIQINCTICDNTLPSELFQRLLEHV